MENDELKITLSVMGEKLTLTIKREEEELYRKAQDSVVKTINQYRQMFAGTSETQDTKKILIMACLSEAFNCKKAQLNNGKADLQNSLEQINNELNQFNSQHTEKK
ncbi:MAG: cell division protein ZapA [Paludibacteraceae bacterium]|jgi:cell division protein ZapA (FtsZ GTPase activity inhibitor)|nr:cell division protein ZapA [Bacteroidales bacterium]MBP3467578.1 cell division protein ZapA [Paludibacteraceae bacterium]MBQ1835469.1 cell division protein ZapA [Paludibacteraceae bacterium]MBQ2050631.1 cell division protein ZapA [Paludibacteraceae bacterium]MBQ2591453.1 cell division protein ZapA [Paludibacteraceae bacterium]